MTHHEYNFDGLIGPTHNYAGLSFGNIASATNKGAVSNPREAALQGLGKMRAAMELGLKQGFLPPQDRPSSENSARARVLPAVTRDVIEKRGVTAEPQLLANCYAASSMWTANAGTIAPVAGYGGRESALHCPRTSPQIFIAPLKQTRLRVCLKHIYSRSDKFISPIIRRCRGRMHFGDEGAANHGRLCENHGDKGVHLFVYGRGWRPKFPGAPENCGRARRWLAITSLTRRRLYLSKQSKMALDAGAFHNDVVGVANGTVLFLHEQSLR